jgi:hypothetical protein
MQAYNTLKIWIEKDLSNVPEWLENNVQFRKELALAISPTLYEKLLEKFGLNYVITAPQVRKLLKKENTNISTVLLVTSAGN